ncbi:cytochrome P450 [Polyangium jinanense]|uniref:Cytochrome P450 n=1 Tax=Polyangium jinanense TaxID=2829994 RepID=A0A9X3X2A8_9BACT|nr:cytochrome P450 [Polyangium jinanense]MDC3954680.1 cytochrome P450 [Polyangium jinanense]MDC3980983.1 cytochrome P450 [Polyangium jinanense]
MLPPGPGSRTWNTWSYITDPVTALSRWRDRYGDTFTLRDWSATTVVTSDPALVKAIFAVRDVGVFGAVAPESFDVILGRRSLLLLSGPEHQAERKLLLGPLCRAALPAWLGAIADATRGAFTGLAKGQTFVALERMREVTLASISQILFGPDDPKEPALRRATLDMMVHVRPSFLVARALQIEGFGRTRFGRFMAASRAFDRLLYARIAEGRARGEQDGSLLALLLAAYPEGQAGDEAIRDELRTLLVGGHETTSSVLAWALYYLHRDPALLARAQAEIDAIAETEGLLRAPLLDAIIDEVMRIRPPAGQCFRMLVEPLDLGPLRVPAGVLVSPAISTIHHREDLWPEPSRFDPARFSNGSRPSPFVYLPFGGGSHRCIGASLSKVESAIILGTILREYRLGLDETREPAWRREGIALCPSPGVRMHVEGRRS